MKRKKLSKKLTLKKEVISNLANIKGGAHETALPMCRPSYFRDTCQSNNIDCTDTVALCLTTICA